MDALFSSKAKKCETKEPELIPTDLPEVPYAGSENPQENLANLAKIKGSYYMHQVMKESGLGVFKLRLFEERIILADPIAINVIYDPELTEKSVDFGLANVNGFTLRGYFPTATVNGDDKATKKAGMWKILSMAEEKYGNEGLYKILKKHWESVLPLIKDEETNVDNLIDAVTVKTLTEFFFDKAFDLDLKTFLVWFIKGLTPKNTPGLELDDVGKQATNQMYDYMDSTPWAQNILPELLKTDSRDAETLKSEALFFAFIFSAFGLKSGLSSTIPLFLNLDDDTRNKILEEIDAFNQDDGKSMDKKLKVFDVTDRFATEVFRYLPPVVQVQGRAKKDFVLNSLQGKYVVKKGSYMTGYSYGAQRNQNAVRCSYQFSTTGDQKHIQENFFAFGGPFNQEPQNDNRKCLGQHISLNMTKMFVALFARCEIEVVSSLKFTESNPTRVIASDEPLRVSEFQCPHK
ncbi:uncharacterized protein [Clytia hemisphaerica]|uniref:Cytochrome P450 n=1 Tax=Clytia hemisphaerica TaxID=252671 RepID=A0A7M5WT63_9CNID|eukprot:TCONS_00031346-protein